MLNKTLRRAINIVYGTANLSLLALFMSWSSLSYGLPNDKEQPINIQSDRASQTILDHGVKTEYFGKVLITQGSLKIQGEHIVIHSSEQKVTKIIARGKPAYFEQQPSEDKPTVKAQANKLHYKIMDETIVLRENASIEQDGSIVSGQLIQYNMIQERVIATGGKDESSRVNMVLTPEKIDNITDKETSPSTVIDNAASNNNATVNTGSAE